MSPQVSKRSAQKSTPEAQAEAPRTAGERGRPSPSPGPGPGPQPARAWQRMLSGRRLDLLDPSPLDIEVEDIAHGLSRVARWNGQTEGDWAFSVAQHSLLVEAIAVRLKPGLLRRWSLAALLHDAAEYVVGDLISPFKAAVGLDYKAFENRLRAAIHLRFSLPPVLPGETEALIKRADHMAAWLEATDLAGFSVIEADQFFIRPPWRRDDSLEDAPLAPLPPHAVKARFLERFDALQRLRPVSP